MKNPMKQKYRHKTSHLLINPASIFHVRKSRRSRHLYLDLQIYIYLRLAATKISSTRSTISLNSTHETSKQQAGSPRGSVVRSFPVLTDSERRRSVLEKRSKARQHGPNTSKRRATPKAAKAEREETLRDSSLTHKYGNRGTAICL